jgi:hypothetical protein
MADESASSAANSSSDSTTKKTTTKKSAAKKSSAKKSPAKKSPAKKSPAKKSPAKKSPAKKSPAKKSPAKKSPAKKPDSRSSSDAPRASSRPRPGPVKVAASAAQQLLELTGREAEGITGLDRTDDGWTVQVEVVEVRRIPDTTDVLGLYEVETDESGELLGYRRVRRYARGNPTEE